MANCGLDNRIKILVFQKEYVLHFELDQDVNKVVLFKLL